MATVTICDVCGSPENVIEDGSRGLHAPLSARTIVLVFDTTADELDLCASCVGLIQSTIEHVAAARRDAA